MNKILLYNTIQRAPLTISLMIALASTFTTTNLYKGLNFKLLLHPSSILREREYYRLISSDFVHHDSIHLFLNEYLLFTFGGSLETYLNLMGNYGSLKFLAIYLCSSLCGSVATTLLHRKEFGFSSAGASGSLMGCMFSYILLQPKRVAVVLPYYGNLNNLYFGLVCILFLIAYQWRSKNDLINHEEHFFGGLGGIIITLLLFPGIIK